MTFKKINAWVHLWFGIASGIVVVILGITGCILVFEQEIRSISSPWLHAAAEGRSLLPPSKLYQAVSTALPDNEVSSIWYHGEDHTAHVTVNSDSTVFVDPYTAKVVAMVDHEDFFHIVEEGHFYLWLPKEIGEQVVGWGTFIFFILLLSGLILWWPKRWNKKSLDQSFKIKWKARFKRLNYDLHNVLGFYSIIVAILLAVTGLMMSFQWFNKGLFWIAGGTDKPGIEAVSDTLNNPQTKMLVQVDKAWHKGINELAEHNPKDIIVSFPEKASEAIYVCTDMFSGTWRDVYLDQHTLEVLPASNKRLLDENAADLIRRVNYGIHVGAIGELPTKILFFIVSLICASLPITGFYIWWGKKSKSKKKAGRSKIKQYLPV
ncbi:PepSY-associated TM helix domain-containing protein [Pedobacter sp. PLR]|uniref:PepSY-associated TM helix domain-containing protein n=1 Tax=Pedobacter sp. PLR TaxID=2994465 RepID=UPI002247D4B0|nr:PepSY-associated TM helix domain-containing protein [Pedobacter sp. PLR]MCX2453844.1 PepSY-associated TM helix domain-containing protein [Pedobacter sp. PLR]